VSKQDQQTLPDEVSKQDQQTLPDEVSKQYLNIVSLNPLIGNFKIVVDSVED
jgi:hypothetical protein